jgi:ferredoxin-type protein NapF
MCTTLLQLGSISVLTAVKAPLLAAGSNAGQYTDEAAMSLTTRRDFLRARRSSAPPPLRPPWALAEQQFSARCSGCGDCLRACPSGILVSGEGRFPTVDFSRGECTFCGDCVAACIPGALRHTEGQAPWSLRARIGEACLAERGVECRICGEVCGASAIRFRPRVGGVALPQLDEAACTGCGACLAPCPSQAIAMSQGVEAVL